MGKKTTKRRTRWRTLSITDSGDEAPAISPASNRRSSEVAAAISHNNSGEVSLKDDTYRHPNTSYLRRKPLYDSSANIRSGYSRSYYKQQSGGFSSRAPYYRRTLQNGASRFFNNRNGAQNNYRSADGNKQHNQARPIINEEEYTRITTPRQDVIFKKGYLSQPRKYLSSTDTNTTSSAAASVVSTEESISAGSVPSLSPEQCSSYAESIDPEQAFMYSYFDQNGVFYFNPYLPNGFDQYAGQMFMLPYSYQPYNVYPPEVNSPPQSTDIEENPTSTDSNENLSDNKETHTQETTPESPIDCDEKTDPPTSVKTTETPENSEKSSEGVATHTEQNEATNQMENFYNYGYQQFYPQVFFPYMYGQQFMPMIENDQETYTEYCNEGDERGATFKNRRKTRPQNDGSSTGVTTTDCSEEDYSDKENISDNVEIVHNDKNTTITAPENSESTEDIKKVIFTADVKEFIPRQPKPHLNVNVKEFLPKNYKPKRSTTSIEGNEKEVTVEEVNESLPKPQRKPVKKDKSLIKVAEETSNSMEGTSDTSTSVTNTATVEPPILNLPTKPIQETPKLTLAERIKRDLAKDSTDTKQFSPPKNNSLNLVSKKKNEIIKTPVVKEGGGMTFAKILTKDRPKPLKSQGKPSSGVIISNKPEKLPAKEVAKESQKQPEPIKVQSNPTSENKDIVQDEWQTVKSKGKRSRHFVKEVIMFEDLPIEKEALDQKVPDEIVRKEEIVKTSSEVPEVIVDEKCEDKIEKDVIMKADEPKDDSEEKSPNSSIIKNSDVQNSQKKNKLRNKKTKKNPSPVKKTKEKETLRISNEEKEIKTDQEDILPQKDDSLLGTPSAKKEDNLLDNLYLMDRNNSLLSKRFCRTPLEILNGFDCKFKANKSILKEEEDMVLNVIKSLSTSQTKILEIKSPKSAESAEELKQKTAQTKINEEQAKNDFSIKKTVEESEESEVSNALQDGTENPISNGISNDYEISEDTEEDTIVQEVPQEMRNSISDKLSDTGSLSDLSVEDFEKKGDIKDCLFKAEIIDEEVCLKITLDRQNEQNELEIKNVSQDEEEQKQEAAIEDDQEECNCQSSQNSLERNNIALRNVPKELTDGHHSESCDLLSHNSLEENILVEDTIPSNPLIVKTNETSNEENLFLETPLNGESNGIAFEDDLVLETAINVGTNKSTIDEDLLPEIETILKGESNGTVTDNDIVLEAIFNGDVGKTTVDESLVLETSPEFSTNKNAKETNTPEIKESTVDETFFDEISLKSTEVGNKIDDFTSKETDIKKTHSKIDSQNDPFFDIELFKPFKYNSEHTMDIKAIFEQKMKENDEEFKNKYTIPQSSEDVKTPLDEEKEILRENSNCLPKEVPSVKINLTETQAPEKEIIPQWELSVAGQKNENNLEDSERNATTGLLTTLLEGAETHNLEVEKSPPLNVVEEKDVAPTAYLSGNPPPIGEKVCEIRSSNSIFLESPLGKLSSTTVVIENCSSESCVESNTAGNCPKITADDILDIKTDSVINAALNEDDLCLECASLTNDSGIINSPTSFGQISSETHDSNKIDLSTINIPALEEDPSKYPLTLAVREWLNQEAKEKTPEPILRIPDDPKLSSIITSSLIERTDYSGGFDEWTSDESDIEDQPQAKPKNLLCNPSRVSSVNFMSNDNDSDYNSDSQQRFDDDDNTRERVAATTSDFDRRVKGDLLDYWDDEFVRDPKKWLGVSSCTNDDKESVFSTTPSEPMTPYESLYGKTIDYDRLLASNYEFLSNNIISFNGTPTAGDKHERTDESRLNNNNINNNDNFGSNINSNHNCLKPPEVCCMIM